MSIQQAPLSGLHTESHIMSNAKLATYNTSLSAFAAYERQKFTKHLESVTPPPRLDTFNYINRVTRTLEIPPEELFRNVIETIYNGLKDTPNFFQANLVQHLLAAVAPLVAKGKWDAVCTHIMRAYNFKQCRPWVLASAPRRIGKSFIIAMFLIAVCRWCPGVNVAVFSTCLRISSEMQKTVVNLIHASGLAHWIVPRSVNRECIKIYSYTGVISTMNFYPSNPKVSLNYSYLFHNNTPATTTGNTLSETHILTHPVK